MAAKNYILRFASGNPTTYTGLSPTFTVFKTVPGGVNITPPPGITEIPTSTGLYYFSYDPIGSTAPVAFVIDGGASLVLSTRYLSNALDPIQAVDQQLTAVGLTLEAGLSAIAGGISSIANFGTSLNSLIGSTASSFGNTATDPATIFGYLKRLQEFNEGDSTFTKTTGLWDIYSRGASTQLIEKALVDSTTSVVKT